MQAARAWLVLLAVAWLVAGCVTVPLGSSGGIDPATAAQLSKDVPLYDSAKLTGNNYIKAGSLTAYGCDNGFLGGPGRDAIVAMLRRQAQSMGGNGLTDLSCGHGATSEVGGCFSSTTCSATALKIFPDAETTN
jgi:hypothetical protein